MSVWFGLFVVAICVGFYVLRRWIAGGVCTSPAKLDGKTVIITGGNSGIGKETAIDLAKRGAKVIIACRNEEKAREALDDIKREAESDLVFYKKLDLASLKSIRTFAESITSSENRLDILVNNAGVAWSSQPTTEDGFEMQFGVNHLGHFLLTNLLLDLLKKSAPSRVVNVSSGQHKRGSLDFSNANWDRPSSHPRAYGQSKLANILFTRELHKKLKGTGVSVFVVTPGPTETDLFRHARALSVFVRCLLFIARYLVLKTARQGAQTLIYCSVQEQIENLSGCYIQDCAPKKPSKTACDDALASKLWVVSEQMVGLAKNT